MNRDLDSSRVSTVIDSVPALQARISELLRGGAEDSALASVASALHEFGRWGLQLHLEQILARRGELERLAAQSYFHGNGFYKIPMIRFADYTVRMHVWRRNASAEENLHSHRWPFASAIILGTLTSQIWVDAIGNEAQVFPELMYRGKNAQFEAVGECRIQLKEVRRQSAGDHYWMGADELHRIIEVGGPEIAVTLMLRPPETRSWARNILLEALIPNAKPVYLSVVELKSVLEEVLGAIAVGGMSK